MNCFGLRGLACAFLNLWLLYPRKSPIFGLGSLSFLLALVNVYAFALANDVVDDTPSGADVAPAIYALFLGACMTLARIVTLEISLDMQRTACTVAMSFATFAAGVVVVLLTADRKRDERSREEWAARRRGQ